MKLPTLRGTIARRILVNYRVVADVLAGVLPAPFRPARVAGGWAMAGICLIRLEHIRPRIFPSFVGIRSENAAHRAAVEWDDGGVTHHGVWVPRRDTASTLNHLAGGRLFPGEHHLATFDVEERDDHYRVGMSSEDGETRVRVAGHVASAPPEGSVFASAEEAAVFFRRGSVAYSATNRAGCFDGMELRTERPLEVLPLEVEEVASSFFDDPRHFPPGTVEFDSAFLMRGVDYEWHARAPLRPHVC